MDFYTLTLTTLLTLSLALFLTQPKHRSPPPPSTAPEPQSQSQSKRQPTPNNNNKKETKGKKKKNLTPFLLAYTLAASSDWLQGAYLTPLYTDEHGVPPQHVPLLFAAGFVAAALSGAAVGRWTDARGRRRACLVFCAVYFASCVLTAGLVPLPGVVGTGLLVVGRVLGGVGTSLLFTAFESWVVGFVRGGGRGGDGDGEELSWVFGVMSGLNSVAAVVCGVVSEWLVNTMGTRKAPFLAAAGVLVLAAAIIWGFWDENYGKPDTTTAKKNTSSARTVLSNPRILALGAASTVFEGSMYLFVFFWAAALRSARAAPGGGLPYGVIFASFMAATLASSLVFTRMAGRGLARRPGRLLAVLLAVSAGCFAASAAPRSERAAFWVFCLFEAAVGMYWPCMGSLKGRLVEDAVRAHVYGLLRVPLNVFVVVCLLVTGNADAYGRVFAVCSSLLAASAGMAWALLGDQE